MHELAAILLKDAVDAYAQRDAERARGVWMRDADLDALEDSVFRDLLTFMNGRPAQYLVLHASPVLLEKYRADRRSFHQYRRDGGLYRDR